MPLSQSGLDRHVPQGRWRLTLGLTLLVLSIVLPIGGVFLVGALDLSVAMAASITTGLVAGSELLGLVAIATMGKPGFEMIKARLFTFLKRHGPPDQVSQTRYRIGLILFCLPLLLGWLAPYGETVAPSLEAAALPLAIAGDILLLTSLFVLGGDFWDKVRSLFVYESSAQFSK